MKGSNIMLRALLVALVFAMMALPGAMAFPSIAIASAVHAAKELQKLSQPVFDDFMQDWQEERESGSDMNIKAFAKVWAEDNKQKYEKIVAIDLEKKAIEWMKNKASDYISQKTRLVRVAASLANNVVKKFGNAWNKERAKEGGMTFAQFTRTWVDENKKDLIQEAKDKAVYRAASFLVESGDEWIAGKNIILRKAYGAFAAPVLDTFVLDYYEVCDKKNDCSIVEFTKKYIEEHKDDWKHVMTAQAIAGLKKHKLPFLVSPFEDFMEAWEDERESRPHMHFLLFADHWAKENTVKWLRMLADEGVDNLREKMVAWMKTHAGSWLKEHRLLDEVIKAAKPLTQTVSNDFVNEWKDEKKRKDHRTLKQFVIDFAEKNKDKFIEQGKIRAKEEATDFLQKHADAWMAGKNPLVRKFYDTAAPVLDQFVQEYKVACVDARKCGDKTFMSNFAEKFVQENAEEWKEVIMTTAQHALKKKGKNGFMTIIHNMDKAGKAAFGLPEDITWEQLGRRE